MSGNLRSLFRSPLGSACRAALFAGALAVFVGPTQAQQINLSLNLFYNDPQLKTSGGTWQLAAKTDEFGLAGLNVLLKDITTTPGTLSQLAPTGEVNGGEAAGFSVLVVAPQIDHIAIAIGQAPTHDGMGDETVFYGVGSIDDPEGGAPNYPNQLTDFPNTTSIGPSIGSLTNINNVPWAVSDSLNDPAWDSAALLLSGSFLPGLTPSFFSNATLESRGTVLTSEGTSSTVGAISDPDSTTVTTIVRDNLTLIDGDFDGDGKVDAADFALWRDTLGQTVVPPGSGADGDNSGTIDIGDYNIWVANFGNMAGSGSLAASSIPEPQTLVLAGLTAAIAVLCRRPQRREKEKR